MPRLTRFKCPECEHTVVVLSTNGQATLRVACETDEAEMRREGYKDNVQIGEVPILQAPMPICLPAESERLATDSPGNTDERTTVDDYGLVIDDDSPSTRTT